MANQPTNPFDFKEQAKALLKRLGQNPGGVLNQGLALAAVEAALREAYARGAEQGRGPVRAATAAATKAPRPGAAAHSTVRAPVAAPPAAKECPHEWEESFLDGRSVGSQCTLCGILQKDVQERCDHFFVKVGSSEVCVACRKAKR